MFHSQLKIHLPQRVCPSPAALGSGVLTLLYGVEEGFRDIAKDMLFQDRLEEKTPPYLMMLFQRSRALMMIIIIINGTARELTNNGEQMIPSWPKKKKSLYACRKLNRSFPGNLKLRCLSQSQLVVFLFLRGELKVQKSNYFQLLHCHMKQNKAYGLGPGSQV